MTTATKAYIGLGSNLNHPVRQVGRALGWLEAHPRIERLRSSRITITNAMGPPQPDYANAVAEIATHMSPIRLLRLLQRLEVAAGRRRLARWGARTLDLDLLVFGDRTLAHPDLVLPHPRLHEREFVLEPLAALAPALRHPRLDQTVSDLLVAVRS